MEIRNFKGTTSKKYDPLVGYLVCSSESVCKDVRIKDIEVKSPSGTNLYACGRIKGVEAMVNCTQPKGMGSASLLNRGLSDEGH